MCNEEGPAASSKDVFEPSHPATGILQEIEIKQSKEVSLPLRVHILSSRRLQDCETLRRGFVKLRNDYARSTFKIAALNDELATRQNELAACQNELATCQNESKLQVIRLQGELKSQNEALSNRVAAAITATRKVRVDIKHPLHVHLWISGGTP